MEDENKVATKKVNILGVNISLCTMEQAVQQIEKFITFGMSKYICLCNVHTIMTARAEDLYRNIANQAGLGLPDGMPLIWAARLFGDKQKKRIYGPDLMLSLCKSGISKGYSHFLYGGNIGVPESLSKVLSSRFPGIMIAGCYSPPFRPLSQKEDKKIVRMINESGADIVWVGLGAPKQERWMAAHLGLIRASVMIGVGAAFDFHTSTVKQAPRWMQDRGLEWFFRLLVEPRRLWRRYLNNNPRFIYLVLKEFLSIHIIGSFRK